MGRSLGLWASQQALLLLRSRHLFWKEKCLFVTFNLKYVTSSEKSSLLGFSLRTQQLTGVFTDNPSPSEICGVLQWVQIGESFLRANI
jgi:hypothetical protein